METDTLMIQAGEHGGYVVINSFYAGGHMPPKFAFAGDLQECLDFAKKHFKELATRRAPVGA